MDASERVAPMGWWAVVGTHRPSQTHADTTDNRWHGRQSQAASGKPDELKQLKPLCFAARVPRWCNTTCVRQAC